MSEKKRASRLSFLLQLLLQARELRAGEKFRQGYLQAVAEHFDGDDRHILAADIHHTIYRGWRHTRSDCQFIVFDPALAANRREPRGNRILYPMPITSRLSYPFLRD